MTDINQDLEILDILETYSEEYHNDTILDELRLRECELKIPGIKGKWASYKAVNNARLYQLKKQRDRLLEEGIPRIKKERDDAGNPVTLKGAEFILKNSVKYKEIDDKITKLTILCDYFEDAVKNIQSIGFDVKNLVETMKLDEM